MAETENVDRKGSYVILVQDELDNWSVQQELTARSGDAALREWLGHSGDAAEGTWVAVPARSWKPVTVTAKQTVTLDLKPAT